MLPAGAERVVGLPFGGDNHRQADLLAEAARHASAYVYLVAHYGKSGTAAAPDGDALRAAIATLRAATDVPIVYESPSAT